jgi:hypothetical protein
VNFSEALVLVKQGMEVKRAGWDGSYLMMGVDPLTGKSRVMAAPMEGTPWSAWDPILYVPQGEDFLAEDWVVMGEDPCPREVRNRLERVLDDDSV